MASFFAVFGCAPNATRSRKLAEFDIPSTGYELIALMEKQGYKNLYLQAHDADGWVPVGQSRWRNDFTACAKS